MGEQRLNARPSSNDLERLHTTSRGIAVASHGHIPAKLLDDSRDSPIAEHEQSVASVEQTPKSQGIETVNDPRVPSDWKRREDALQDKPASGRREEGLRDVALARVGHDRHYSLALRFRPG
jgi:hypothetical protein